ncbi:ABC transporter permease [Salimicrobium halophilum]|uniref:ABC-2 type transport system permease protein n=1 Tax=Salimicrobium halophilum TaxID=86666 RepID=A0A1G8VUN0_9BACI|nr:ABC transporter permease [Salimicrobium halophilum]SDJ69175.1 ABC-2 type transport system permease protein [Salimicrobium halophilum]
MVSLSRLIQNEWMKLFQQRSTWIMIILFACLIIGYALFMTTDFSPSNEYGEDWKQQLQQENEEMRSDMEDMPATANYMGDQIRLNEYRIQNNIAPDGFSGWNFVQENRMFVALISLFTIIIAAGSIANEFRWGSIKLLLIRPVSRTKILASKFITVLLFAIMMLAGLFLLSMALGALMFGIGTWTEPYLFIQNGEVKEMTIMGYSLMQYGFSSVNLLMMVTFAFMISAVFRNSALAIGTAIFLMMTGNSIVTFFSDKEWAKYILFANTDLNQFVMGTPMIEDLTMSFSISVLAVYFVVFLAASWLVFTKRDVAST